MGRLQAEQFGDYEKAKLYYAEALANKLDFQKVYSKYILVLIWNEDYEEAQKLIDFAFTVKGLNKGEIHLYQGQLFENLQAYKIALKAFKKAKLFGYNSGFISHINSEITRVKNKMKPKKKKKKPKYKKKKNKKKRN
jgi:tetratricopeptide (TPR) repeat protein